MSGRSLGAGCAGAQSGGGGPAAPVRLRSARRAARTAAPRAALRAALRSALWAAPLAAPRAVLVPALLCLLSACAVGPDYHRPATEAGSRYTPEALPAQTAETPGPGGTPQHWVSGQPVPAHWWTVFGSPALDALVEEALRANPGIAGAQAALHQASELAAAQRGLYFPTVQAGFAPTRQKNPVGTLAPTLNSGIPIYNLYTAQLSVGYTLDLFGGNRRQVEALVAQAEQQRFALQATQITLATNVVVAAVQEAATRAQIGATERMVDIETEQLQILRKEVELGAIADADASAQEVLLAQTVALLAPLRKQLALQRDALAVLLGRLPSQGAPVTPDLDALQLPAALPLSLPSTLVEQRPDVRIAEEQLHAASAGVGVALADMLPQISLSASLGGTATRLGSMFAAGNQFWSAGASLSQTLFAGGALYHRERAAVAAFDQAGAQYRGAVLAAFQNVADSLQALVFDADAYKANHDAEAAAQRSLAYARHALDLGSVSYLALLNADQAYQQALVNRVQAQANRYADTAALFQALGGGWWNDAPAAR